MKKKPKPKEMPFKLSKDLANIPSNIESPATSIKHMPNLGDQIAVLPACKRFWEVTGRK